MSIKPLFDLCCMEIAKRMDGKSPDELREMFGLEDDLSEQEKEAIGVQNIWGD